MLLISELAIALWQNRRVHRAELGDIQKGITAATGRDFAQEIADDPCTSLSKRSSQAIERLQLLISLAIGELERDGMVSRETCDRLDSMFGEGDVMYNPAFPMKFWFFDEIPDLLRRLMPDGITKGMDKKAVARAHLEERWDMLGRLRRKARLREKLASKIELQSLSIPNGPVAERIQRYETNVQRRINRLIDQLERLQRRRRGEPPMPTLNLNLKNDDGSEPTEKLCACGPTA